MVLVPKFPASLLSANSTSALAYRAQRMPFPLLMKAKPANKKSRTTPHACDAEPTPRRSIPVPEVNRMLEEVHRSHEREPTLYDQRIDVLGRIQFLTASCDSLQDRLNESMLDLNSERNRLKIINAQLSQELRMDQIA